MRRLLHGGRDSRSHIGGARLGNFLHERFEIARQIGARPVGLLYFAFNTELAGRGQPAVKD